MGRSKTIFTSEHPYHITARCINKEWFSIPMDLLWQHFSDVLHIASLEFKIEILAFVLMDNHFHLIIYTPNSNIDKTMHFIMKNISTRITLESGRINQTFGGPYKWSIIKSPIHLLNAYKYLYRNPVNAGMVKVVEEYKYSSLQFILGKELMLFPVFNDFIFHSEFKSEYPNYLNWLNNDFSENHNEKIRRALNKREFKVAKNSYTHQNSLLDMMKC